MRARRRYYDAVLSAADNAAPRLLAICHARSSRHATIPPTRAPGDVVIIRHYANMLISFMLPLRHRRADVVLRSLLRFVARSLFAHFFLHQQHGAPRHASAAPLRHDASALTIAAATPLLPIAPRYAPLIFRRHYRCLLPCDASERRCLFIFAAAMPCHVHQRLLFAASTARYA